MNFYPLSMGFTSLFSLALGLFVIWHNPKSRIHLTWGLACLLCFLWSFFFFLEITAEEFEEALIWTKLLNIAAIYMSVVIAHFAQEVIKPVKSNFRVIQFGYVLATPLALLIIPGEWICSTRPIHSFRYFTSARHGYWTYLACFLFYAAYSIYLLIKSLAFVTGQKRMQIKYILAGLGCGLLCGSTAFLATYSVPIEPVLLHFVWLYAAIISYAIAKHRLMDIRVVIRKTVFYSLATFIISILYIGTVSALQMAMTHEHMSKAQILTNISLIALFALILKPMEIFFNKTLDRKFFKGTIEQIAEQKAHLESELERAERLKSVGILAAGMAHEIKNPLTSIRTFAEFLNEKHDDPVFREKFSRIAISETSRISALIQDLLLFAKPSEPKFEKVDLGGLVQDVFDLLSGDLAKKGIKADLQSSHEGIAALVDRSQMKQALLNIILNAIDALKDRPRKEISVSTRESEGIVEMAIQDSGIGIAPDKIKHLFDPFFTDKEGGNGLGLAITHSIIQRNGGSIRVESVVGEGSTFYLILKKEATRS